MPMLDYHELGIKFLKPSQVYYSPIEEDPERIPIPYNVRTKKVDNKKRHPLTDLTEEDVQKTIQISK